MAHETDADVWRRAALVAAWVEKNRVKLPHLGATLTFRVVDYAPSPMRRYLTGRVVAVEPRALVVVDRVAYAVERPRPSAHWKGSRRPAGAYRGTPIWAHVGHEPDYQAAPRTWARLVEVRAYLGAIGAWDAKTPEEAAALAVVGEYKTLAQLRWERDRTSGDVRAYLDAVIEHDAEAIDDAEFAEARQRLHGYFWWKIKDEYRVIPPSEADTVTCWAPWQLRRAYWSLEPELVEAHRRWNELRRRREEREAAWKGSGKWSR